MTHNIFMRQSLLIIALLGLVSAAHAREPKTVSPGAPDRVATIGSDCPTFNWTRVPGATQYELVVAPLFDGAEPRVAPELEAMSTEGLLHEQLPGGATGWTPELSRCLVPGHRYVWFVRAHVESEGTLEVGDWSPGRIFRVAAPDELVARIRALADESSLRVASADHSVAPELPSLFATGSTAPGTVPAAEHRGFLADEKGVPLNGSYDLVLRLWDKTRGGTMIWGPTMVRSVVFVDGRYEVSLAALELEGRAESGGFLEVEIAGEIVTPRQRTSLASRRADLPSGTALETPVPATLSSLYGLHVDHSAEAEARGAYFRGDGYGIYVEEIGAGGDVGLYSPDFIRANGYRSDSPSYLWVPATAGNFFPSTGCTAWPRYHGSVQIECSSSGTNYFNIPITVPGVLFGQNVEVTAAEIYYDLDSAASYISRTRLRKQTGAGSSVALIDDDTDRTSTTSTDYSLSVTANGVLDSSAGTLNLHFTLSHDGDVDHDITIGGVRLTLRHRP